MSLPPPQEHDHTVASRLTGFESLGNSTVNKADCHVLCDSCGFYGDDGSFSAYPEQAFLDPGQILVFLGEQGEEFPARKCPECGKMAKLSGIRLFVYSGFLALDLVVDFVDGEAVWRFMDSRGRFEMISPDDPRLREVCLDSCLRTGSFFAEVHPEGDGQEARDLLSFVTRGRPDSHEAHLGLARLLFASQRDERALHHVDRAAEFGNHLATCCHDLGVLLSDAAIPRSDPELLGRAVTWFRKAIKLDPTNATNYLNLGRVLVQTGNLAEGRKVLRRVARVDKRYTPSAQYHLGLADLRDDRPGSAAGIFAELTQIAPHDVDVRRMHALALVRSGQRARAEKELAQAELLQPGHEENLRIRQLIEEHDRTPDA